MQEFLTCDLSAFFSHVFQAVHDVIMFHYEYGVRERRFSGLIDDVWLDILEVGIVIGALLGRIRFSQILQGTISLRYIVQRYLNCRSFLVLLKHMLFKIFEFNNFFTVLAFYIQLVDDILDIR